MTLGGRQVVRPHPDQIGALADRDLAPVVEADRSRRIPADQLRAVGKPESAVGGVLEHSLQRAYGT